MRVTALQYVRQQRALDQCLHPVLEARCATLSRLSTTNQALRLLVKAAAAGQGFRAVLTVFGGPLGPILGQTTAATLEGVRNTARTIARMQDGLIAIHTASSTSALRCGLPLKGLGPLRFLRHKTAESRVGQVPAPLEWPAGSPASELHLRSWNLAIESFGHCQPDSSRRPLSGERYLVSLRHADGDRFSLRPFSFWSSFSE